MPEETVTLSPQISSFPGAGQKLLLGSPKSSGTHLPRVRLSAIRTTEPPTLAGDEDLFNPAYRVQVPLAPPQSIPQAQFSKHYEEDWLY